MKNFVFGGMGLLFSAKVLAVSPVNLDDPDRIPGHYIVKLKENTVRDSLSSGDYVVEQAGRLQATYGITVLEKYSHIFPGLAIKAKDEQLEALSADAEIELIEADKIMRASSLQTPAAWGLDRVDARSGLDETYSYTVTGAGVHAYIIDSGIRTTHSEFTGRMGPGAFAINDGRGVNDCNGHGTHVAGTVGGTIHGVAKDVTLHPVRVLGCDGSGSNSGVLSGVEWVTAQAIKPAVANMSLGGGASAALDEAVRKAVKSGVVFVVAAGNDNRNACNGSPARVAAAITVGSTTKTDARSSFSNFGRCVDIFAPGSSITSAGRTSDTATNVLSGTSMASPHVAGVAALFLEKNPEATPAEIDALMKKNASPGVVTNPGTGSPNLLLYSNPEGE